MSFLSQLVANLAVVALNWAYGKISSLLTRALEKKRVQEEIRAKNKQIREQTESAQTKEERDAAAENDIRNF